MSSTARLMAIGGLTLLLASLGPAALAQSPSAPTDLLGASPSSSPMPSAMPAFGDGVFLVGLEIAPGLYRSSGTACTWQRLAGFSGEPADVIATDTITVPTVVGIAPTDVGFSSEGCGPWTALLPALPSAAPSGSPGVPSIAPSASATTPTPTPRPLPTPLPTARPTPTRTPVPTPDRTSFGAALDGAELAYSELNRTGTLGLTLKQFVRRWNQKVGLKELRIGRLPTVKRNSNGAQVFTEAFGSSRQVLVLLGRMEGGKLASAALIWQPSTSRNELTRADDLLTAMLLQTALMNAVNPRLPARTVTIGDMAGPRTGPGGEAISDPYAGVEDQRTFDGVTYALIGYIDEDGAETVWLTAREEGAY